MSHSSTLQCDLYSCFRGKTLSEGGWFGLFLLKTHNSKLYHTKLSTPSRALNYQYLTSSNYWWNIISSDRSSCTDDGLLYIYISIRPLFQILSIYAFLYCYKCHSKLLKQYQCNWCHKHSREYSREHSGEHAREHSKEHPRRATAIF